MKACFVLGLVTLLLNSTASFAGNYPGYSSIFTIDKSTNANEVVYEVDLANASNPVHPYWIMRAQDGHLEELTSIERSRAFGISITSRNASGLQFKIVALQSHPVTVKTDPNTHALYATMNLDGSDRILVNCFLHLSGGLIPSVSTVDVMYKNTFDGPVLRLSFDPNNE